MTQVLVVGGVAYNTMIEIGSLPDPHPQTIFSRAYHETLGSTGAGKALNLAPLGLDVMLHALLGDDAPGQQAQKRLAAAGVDFHHDLDPDGTKRHINLMDDAGDRISIHIVPGTFEPVLDLPRLEALVPACDIAALNIINYTRCLIPALKRHHKPIWVDIHDYDGQATYHQDYIDAADVLFMSSDALPDYRTFMQRQIEDGKQFVVCTHGKDGSTALMVDGTNTGHVRWIETPIIDTYRRVDTNGAGDAFFSGVLWGYTQGCTLQTCLRLGTIVSGLCITSRELAHPDLSAARVWSAYRTHYQGEFAV